MKVESQERRGVVVVEVHGRVTVGPDLLALRSAVEDALSRSTPPRIVLDVANVLFVDSGALGEIVACRRRVRDAGGELVIARPRGKVRDLLDLTRIDRLVTIFPELDPAVDALAEPR